MSTTDGAVTSRAELLDEIEHSQRFLLATHENPDGDALGSLAGMQLVLTGQAAPADAMAKAGAS